MSGFNDRGNGWKEKSPGRVKRHDRDAAVYNVDVNRSEQIEGIYPSYLTGRTHPAHSDLELQWLELVEVLPDVKGYASQPKTFEFELEGKRRLYTPDTRIDLAGGKTVFTEVKPLEIAERQEMLALWPVLKRAIGATGADFKVVTEEIIRAEPCRENVTFLNLYRTVDIPDPVYFELQALLADTGAATIAELADFVGGEGRVWIYGLIFHHVLQIDLDAPLTDASLVQLNLY